MVGVADVVAQNLKEHTKLVGAVRNYGFFDNREVRTPYQRSQTLFGTMLDAEIGIKHENSYILAGKQVIKDFGTNSIAYNNFSFYYKYQSEKVSGAFGVFPRSLLQRELPDIFLYDSIRYYTPTLQGALIQYKGENGTAEFYCNWLNRQSTTEREIFELVTDGCFYIKDFFTGWNMQLMHYSVPKPNNGLKVYDKAMINPYIGLEKEFCRFIDNISIQLGMMLSLNRDRKDMIWKTPVGLLTDMSVTKGRLEVRDRTYIGQAQFSDYDIHGMQLHRGDPYYRSNLYNRSDFNYYLLNKKYVQCYAGASFHYTEGSIDCSQQVVLRINID